MATPENPHAFYPLVCHLVDTAALAGALFDVLFTEQAKSRIADEAGVSAADLRALLGFWAGLHDIGKISPPYQRKVPRLFEELGRDPAYRVGPEVLRDDLHHSEASHWALIDVFANLGYPRAEKARRDVGHQIAQLLGGHHGRFHQALERAERQTPREARAGLGAGAWEGQCHAHAHVLRELTGANAVPPRPLPVTVAVIVAGLVMVADWLASQEDFIRDRIPLLGWTASPDEVRAHWKRVVAEAPDVVARAGLGRAEFPDMEFTEQFPFDPNPLQASLVDELPDLVNGPGLLLVTAPPGEGKTEAALWATSVLARAAGVGGMVFALPTMATTDAMHKRVAAYAAKTLSGQSAALTKVHSTAWLAAPDPGDTNEIGTETTLIAGAAHEPTQWLLGARRGLLAPLSVVTVDQLLTGVLPVRYNVMRLLAGSGKVVVVDEAHAYGSWMNELLLRLVEWLGAFRTPVILLSATLAGESARAMVDAYRRGAGHAPSPDEDWSPVYPGWVFVDAATGVVSEPRAVHSERARQVRFDVQPVRRDITDTKDPAHRLAVIRKFLGPIVTAGGNALVCCTTVAEAQATWDDLREWLAQEEERPGPHRPEPILLHSRFRMGDRAATTDRVEIAFGKDGPRPEAAIVVATQIVEQSLDLDFDVVVSDLAPVAQLLQRSGRCRRHEDGGPKGEDLHALSRPSWVADGPATVVVLDPVDENGGFELPRAWGEKVYDESLLRRTSRRLREAPVVAVPEDVQPLIDHVYGGTFGVDRDTPPDSPVLAAEHAAERRRVVTDLTERGLAETVDIKAPYGIGTDLHRLTSTDVPVDESLITTRLGADSGQMVCVYEHDHGWTLDEAGEVPVPGWGTDRRLTREEQKLIAKWMIPTPGSWLRADADLPEPPLSWQRSSIARYWLTLPMRRAEEGEWRGRLARGPVAYESDGRGLHEPER